MPFEGSPFRQAGTILHRVIQAVGVLPLDLLVKLPSSWTRGSRLVTALYATFWSGAKCCMKPTTFEWIYKAVEDWHVAQMSYRARKHPSYDATVFHAQQCAVKYLKARLEEAAISRHSYPYPPPETREGKG
jgi:hypothetical protein